MAWRRPQDALATLVQPALDLLLDGSGTGPRAERHKDGHPRALGEALHHVLVDVGGLACACMYAESGLSNSEEHTKSRGFEWV